MKKNIKIIISVLIIILLCVGLVYVFINNIENSSEKEEKMEFSKLYNVDENHVFETISVKDAVDLLENGTGIIYLGYSDCPWCQDIVPLLNESAKNNDVSKVYYIEDFYNMRPDKTSNPKYQNEYNKIVDIIKKYEDKINEQIKEDNIIKVPLVLFVKDGEILGYQKGTVEGHNISQDENGNNYLRDLTDEEEQEITKKLNNLINKIYPNACSGSC